MGNPNETEKQNQNVQSDHNKHSQDNQQQSGHIQQPPKTDVHTDEQQEREKTGTR